MSASRLPQCRRGHPRTPQTTWSGKQRQWNKSKGEWQVYEHLVCRLCRRKANAANQSM
ncbi:hypothetical protein [Phenylobacterium sp.]|uniref:hypothetical protein n=1 Tax=Phenylobacterium sp. TaxID=1871053 RepID=UPI0025DF3CC2|nr:hypothetical protein [Phenylobacterium sp.]